MFHNLDKKQKPVTVGNEILTLARNNRLIMLCSMTQRRQAMAGTILIVDDIATNRIVLKVKLADACYETLQCATGQEALRLARATS